MLLSVKVTFSERDCPQFQTVVTKLDSSVSFVKMQQQTSLGCISGGMVSTELLKENSLYM